MNPTKNPWTSWSIFFAILLSLNIVVIGTWLFINYDQLEKISDVAGKIWGVITIFPVVAIINQIIAKKGIGYLFSLRLVRIFIAFYTIIGLSAFTIFMLTVYEHRIEIDVTGIENGTNVTFIWGETDTNKFTKEGVSWAKFRKPARLYEVIIDPDGYEPKVKPIEVKLLPLSQKFMDTTTYILSEGSLYLEFIPETAKIEIVDKSKTILSNDYSHGQATLTLKPGTFYVHASAQGYQSSHDTIVIKSGQTTRLTITLHKPPQQYGSLTINSDPENMDIYIDGSAYDLKTPVEGEFAIWKRPGTYHVKLMKVVLPEMEYGYYWEDDVIIREQEKTPVSTGELTPIQLSRLIIHPTSTKSAKYYLDDMNNFLGEYSNDFTVPAVFPHSHILIKVVDGTRTEHRFTPTSVHEIIDF